MTRLKQFVAAGLALAYVCAPLTAFAADKKAKPYPLDTCIVSDEKLGEMGDPYVFVHKGQEIKLCCKSCKKDFDKSPGKFMKKLAQAEKKEKEKNKK